MDHRIENFLDYDFESTIRDYEFTRQMAFRMNSVVSSADFEEMDSQMITKMLLNEIDLVSFGDYLKRYIYEKLPAEKKFSEMTDEEYIQIIKRSFELNKAPHSLTPTTRKWGVIVKSFVKADTVQRSTVFLLGFGLRMSEQDVSEFLVKVLREEDFDFTNPEEVIYYYCYRKRLPYADAVELLQKYERGAFADEKSRSGFFFGKGKNEEAESWETMLSKKDFEKKSETYLSRYLTGLAKENRAAERKNHRYEIFGQLYDRTREVVAAVYTEEASLNGQNRKWTMADITPSDVEKVLCSGTPINEKGNMVKMSVSLLSRYFQNRRITRQRISDIMKRQVVPDRFDYITMLFYIYAVTVEPDWPAERYALFLDEINEILTSCHMVGLYPPNAYEAFLSLCLLADIPMAAYSEVIEYSYQEKE